MKKILAITSLALLGCTGNKLIAKNSNLNTIKIEQCYRILNAPDFFRDGLKNLNPDEVEIHKGDTITYEICKPLETIICDGIEYRLYDVCSPSKTIIYTIATEEDYL
jgi:hypothetical protein